MRVAVMQPYFYPYLLYYHLIASVDVFVVFDCVQFPRRGRVHRAPLPNDAWLTLPLAKHPRSTRITDLRFAEGADPIWQTRMAALPWLSASIRSTLAGPLASSVSEYLRAQLTASCALLGITTPLRTSSELDLDPALRGMDRVIAATRAVGGRDYVNLPGGRELYAPADYSTAGLSLSFLQPYTGTRFSMLHALSTETEADLQAELRDLPQPERVS